MERFADNWPERQSREGPRYTCGYCGTDTTPAGGWKSGSLKGFVLLCTNCNKPSFIEIIKDNEIRTTPSAKLGKDVAGLPNGVKRLYDEARDSTSVGAYTSAVLICRKILMHIAVEKEAHEGLGFLEYVNYLAENNYIPPDGKKWVDHIRKKSNEANHQIVIMTKNDADDLISFTEMLLRFVYEFPQRIPRDTD